MKRKTEKGRNIGIKTQRKKGNGERENGRNIEYGRKPYTETNKRDMNIRATFR
jgi:hypothetical protein